MKTLQMSVLVAFCVTALSFLQSCGNSDSTDSDGGVSYQSWYSNSNGSWITDKSGNQYRFRADNSVMNDGSYDYPNFTLSSSGNLLIDSKVAGTYTSISGAYYFACSGTTTRMTIYTSTKSTSCSSSGGGVYKEFSSDASAPEKQP